MIGTITRHNDIGVIYNQAPQDQEYYVLIYSDEGEIIGMTFGNGFVASVKNLFACTERQEMQDFIDDNSIYLGKYETMGDKLADSFFEISE